jgi:DNA invertase Pin-like site-specific DNA recombinase
MKTYGYIRLRNQSELGFFEEYQSITGQQIDKMYQDIVLGQTTTTKRLDEMISKLKKGDLVVFKTLTNVCSSFEEIYELLSKINKKGATVDIAKKSSGEQFYCSEEGVKALEVTLKTQANMNAEPQARSTITPHKERIVAELYEMFIKFQKSEITIKEIAEELQTTEQSVYKYIQQLKK